MVTETVVERVLKALARGEAVAAVALHECGLDRKTVRTWVRRGSCVPRTPRATVSCLDLYKVWLACRAPDVGYNATVLFRVRREQRTEPEFCARDSFAAPAHSRDVGLWCCRPLRPGAVHFRTHHTT